MKGLLLKDLYTLKGFAKQYGIIFGFMLIWSIAMKTSSFFVMYTLVLGSMIVLTTMGTDEAVSFNRFALTMPVGIKQLVKAKYVLLFITAGSGFLISLLVNTIFGLIWKEGSETFGGDGIIGAVFVFICANAIAMPMMFKLSVEKARYVFMAVMIVLAFAILGGVKILELLGVSLEGLNEVPIGLVLLAMGIVMMVGIIISYRAAVAFAKKREW